jgi:hypothetical protein
VIERRGVKKEDGDTGTGIDVVETSSGREVGVGYHPDHLKTGVMKRVWNLHRGPQA